MPSGLRGGEGRGWCWGIGEGIGTRCSGGVEHASWAAGSKMGRRRGGGPAGEGLRAGSRDAKAAFDGAMHGGGCGGAAQRARRRADRV